MNNTDKPIMCIAKGRGKTLEWCYLNIPYFEASVCELKDLRDRMDSYLPDIVCLFGVKEPERLVDDVCKRIKISEEEMRKLEKHTSAFLEPRSLALLNDLLNLFPNNQRSMLMLLYLLSDAKAREIGFSKTQVNKILKAMEEF